MTAHETPKAILGQVNYDWEKGEIEMEPEIAAKIRIFRKEISKLATEKNELQMEKYSRLVADKSTRQEDSEDEADSDSSSDSESSNDDSSSESDSSSSEDSDG